MAHYNPHSAVVESLLVIDIVEGSLQNTGWEHYLIASWGVVGVNCRWGHVPSNQNIIWDNYYNDGTAVILAETRNLQ